MRFARTFKPHVEIDRLTASAVIAMVTLSVISVLPTVMMDQLPFPASLSLGVAVVLVLRFDRRFAAYYALTASIVALVIWVARGGAPAESISIALFVSVVILQGLTLLVTPWLLGDRRRDLETASLSVGGVARLFLVVIPFVSLAPAIAVFLLAWAAGDPDPIPTTVAVTVQGLIGCYATAPFAMAMLRDESGRRCHTCHCERRWLIMTILAGITILGLAHHPVVAGEQVLMQTLLALASLSLLAFLALLSGWMATAAGTFLLAFTTDAALVATASPAVPSLTDPDLIANSGVWVSAKMRSVLPVIAIALPIASITEVHHRHFRRLKDRDERLGGMLDDAATGLIRTDRQGRIFFANEAAVSVIGTDPNEGEEGQVEILIQSLITPTSHRRLRRGLRAAGDGRGFQCELDVVAGDGSSRIHLALFSPVRDPGGAGSVLITMLDIDSRERGTRRRKRRYAERTRDARESRELDRMTALVMSDVNNLATALAGVSSLSRGVHAPARLDRMLETLETGCETAARHAARLRHVIPGAAVSNDHTDVAGHLRDRLHRAASLGRIHLERVDASPRLAAPVPGAFFDLIVEELIHDLESNGGSPRPTISVSVTIRRAPTARTDSVLEIRFGSSRRRTARSIAALTGDRASDTPADPTTLGLTTIADRIDEIGGSIEVEDHEAGTIVSIRMPGSNAMIAHGDGGPVVEVQPGLNRRA